MADDAPCPERVGPYRVLELLGSGAFATVYKAEHTPTTCTVALKAIRKDQLRSQTDVEYLQREISLMRGLDHPFIATLFEVREDAQAFYLSMELVENGNLLDFINDRQGLTEEDTRRLFFQLLSALDYLHREKRIVHRDLKAENVLLDRFNNIRLVDFGLSNSFSQENPFLTTICGSPAYVSPEVFREEPYTTAADVWASGVLLYAMTCSCLPFEGENLTAMLQAILAAAPVLPARCSPEFRALMARLLAKDPRQRITIAQVFEHPWLAEYARLRVGMVDELRLAGAGELDPAVVSEMRVLGLEPHGLMDELRECVLNERTAVYKMLRKVRMAQDLQHLELERMKRKAEGRLSVGRMLVLPRVLIAAVVQKPENEAPSPAPALPAFANPALAHGKAPARKRAHRATF
jgi:tRNA A-37 threonylcarbamoyl transferase component Bud32